MTADCKNLEAAAEKLTDSLRFTHIPRTTPLFNAFMYDYPKVARFYASYGRSDEPLADHARRVGSQQFDRQRGRERAVHVEHERYATEHAFDAIDRPAIILRLELPAASALLGRSDRNYAVARRRVVQLVDAAHHARQSSDLERRERAIGGERGRTDHRDGRNAQHLAGGGGGAGDDHHDPRGADRASQYGVVSRQPIEALREYRVALARLPEQFFG